MTRSVSARRAFLTSAVFLALLAGLAALVLQTRAVWGFDQMVIDTIMATRNAASNWIVVLVTLFGDGTALTLIGIGIVVALALRAAWWPAVGCAVVFLSTPFIVKAIKLLVGRDRPVADLYSGVESFSFPSGHMTNSMVIYGALALFAARALDGVWRGVVLAGLAVLIVSIGASRVYLGAHWPSDVIAAMLLASAMLSVIWWTFSKSPPATEFLKAFLLVAAFTAAVWAVYSFMTLEVALNHYSLDVTPEGTIELDSE
ncbi:phosphatase PAP2 family protein [Henriciella sp. AS95]|uniref:phosphatase PAP2 family protein n=1 Tax=Henriciella sp. AS95 TaxID=3135782 RepID=UPI00317261D7